MTVNLNEEVQVMEIETTFIKLNKLYLRNDGKVIHTIKEHPGCYTDNNGVDRSTDITMEGSDGYYYSHKDGRAYTHGTNYEMFLVAEVTCDLFTTLEDLDKAQEKFIFVKPW